MIMAGMGPTNPEAGVIATSPATAPLAAPRTVGLPLEIHSVNIQERAAAAVARWVTTKALVVSLLAAMALPAKMAFMSKIARYVMKSSFRAIIPL